MTPPPTASTTAFATDVLCLEHRNDGHPERPERLAAILEQLERTGLRARVAELAPRDATDDEIRRVHSAGVIERARELASGGGGWADIDTFVNAESPAVARRAAGLVIASMQAVLGGEARNAFAAVRPPGHHATGRQLMGFCLLNNVAMAAGAALDAGVQRVAIVDWDVHHGNGTQAIFDADPRVLYFSTHAAPYYPGTGGVEDAGVGWAKGTKVNVPLPHGTSDAGFLAAYERVCVPVLERFRPEIVLVSSGWDAHARDPLAPLMVSTEGYTRVARLVRDAAEALCDGRMVVALEGGYDEHALAWCASGLVEVLLGEEPTPDPEPVVTPIRVPAAASIEAVIASARRVAGLG